MRLFLRDLEPGQLYKVAVRAKANGSTSQWSQLIDVQTTTDATAPNAPSALAWTVEGTAFKATWTAPTLNEDGSVLKDFKDFQVTLYSSAAPAVKAVYYTTASRYDFPFESNLAAFGTPRASVTIEIRSRDLTGNVSTTPVTATAANAAPTTPANVTGTAIVDGVSIKWDSVTDSDLKEYRVYYGTTAAGATTLVWSGRGTSYTHVNSLYGTDAYYKVVSADVFNTESPAATIGAFRPKSSAGVDTNAPAAVTGLAATLTTSSSLVTSANVSWTAVADPDNDLAGYRIGYRPVGASDWQYTDVDYTLTSTRIDRLTPYVNYEFRIRAYDFSFNMSAWSATVTTTTAATNSAPATPSTPTVSSSTQRIQVAMDGKNAAGSAMDSDVVLYEVYASTANGFTPDSTNILGTIQSGPATVGTFSIPASGSGTTQTWYVKVIAVDAAGLKSAPSAQATANPNLIQTANIGDAQITNAKISDLAADKITAGTGFINALTVKSKFTLGDATTDGIIESYDYTSSAGATGFRLAKSGLIIKTGAIEAAALKIQSSPNMMPPEFAGFEYVPSFYTGYTGSKLALTGNTTATVKVTGVGGTSKFGAQYLEVRDSGTNPIDVAFAQTYNDLNIPVEAGKTYIVSAWVRAYNVTTTLSFLAKYSDLTQSSTFGSITLTANTPGWQRQSGTITIPANVTSMTLRQWSLGGTAGSGWDVDAIQVEEKISSSSTPSSWSAPGLTRVDGNSIRTGSIQSSSTVTVNGTAQPAWSINLSGNAQFGDSLVRGKLIVGTTGDPDSGQSYISSGNYVAGSAGWKIDSSGAAEFNKGTFRGAVAIGKPTAISPPTMSIKTVDNGSSYNWFGTSGTYYYKITGFNVGGETVGSNELSVSVTNGSAGSPIIYWSNLPLGLNGVKIYRGTAAGAENVLVATINGSYAGQFLDRGNGTTTAGSPPSVSTISNAGQTVNIDSQGFYAGATTFATAPFTIDLAGNVNAPLGVMNSSDFYSGVLTGKRMGFGNSTGNDTIKFFSGIANEGQPGLIKVSAQSDAIGYYGQVDIITPQFTGQTGEGDLPTFSMRQANPGASQPQSNVTITATSGQLGPLSWSSGITAASNPFISKFRTDPQQYSLQMASGWSAYGAPFSAPRAYRMPDGSWALTGLFKRTGAGIAVDTTGVVMGTIPQYSAATRDLMTCISSVAAQNYCVQIGETGQITVRQATGSAVTFPTGAWISIAGNVTSEAAN